MQNEAPKKKAEENNPTNPAARHNARRYAVQAIYQWQLAESAMPSIENEFIQYHIKKKTDLIYFKELIHGIADNTALLDDEMMPFLGRSMEDIDPIELAVVRIAIFEFKHRLDIPYRIILNEALELTKEFGSVDGYKFVNGLLDKVARKIRVTEIQMRK